MRLFGHGAPRVDEDGQRHADAYVRPRVGELALRFPDGEPTGFELHGAPLVVRVRSIPRAMHYKRPQDPPVGHSKRGAKWLHFGDPGADQGEHHDIHYSYLC